ncbi:MAG TPA: hypothetical protein VJC18_02400 [bacterium]|nr:hypothetical protein [bacterium]
MINLYQSSAFHHNVSGIVTSNITATDITMINMKTQFLSPSTSASGYRDRTNLIYGE